VDFRYYYINIIDECRVNFGVILPSSLITSRTIKFMYKLKFLENSFSNMLNYPVYLAHRTSIMLHLFACLFALFLYIVFVFVYYYSTISGE